MFVRKAAGGGTVVIVEVEQTARTRLRALGDHPNAPKPGGGKDFFVVKTDGRWVVLKFKDINAIVAHDHRCQIHAGKDRHVVRDTVSALHAQLPQDHFFRINRATVINLDRIRAIHSKSHGDGVAELADGQSFTISRRYRPALAALYAGLENT